jgi:hypothetical protein
LSDQETDQEDDLEDEVVFELADWTDDDRQALHEKLNEAGIGHEWEETDLVVGEADADAAEDAIEAIEYPDELAPDPEGDDGGVGYELMSALFVAADRLQHDPDDPRTGGEFDNAADAVIAAATPPYGVAPEVWKQVQELAHNVCEQLDDADPDVIARDAAALRQLLSRYV